ncbi:MAG: hypothetical protein LBB40_01685 [Holophagales bacterium]|jgi:hypothetical protein|nr:hypothetical protein [Holophagales bacterium]
MRFVFNSILKAIIFLNGLMAFAQQSAPGQWVDGLYLVHQPPAIFTSRYFIDENDRINRVISNLSKAVDFPIPLKYRDRSFNQFWHNDGLYTCSAGSGSVETNEDGTITRRHIFAKWQDDEWFFLGEHKTTNKADFLFAIPCDNDRFVVVSNMTDLTNNNRPDRTPFFKMSLLADKKEIRLDSSIDHGQDELRPYMSDDRCFRLAFGSHCAVTDSHAFLVNRNTGLYWVFSLGNASLIKAGHIFKQITPEMIVNNNFRFPITNSLILCVNPEINGTVLVAGLDEAFYLTETSNLDEEIKALTTNTRGMTINDLNNYEQKRREEIARGNPYIVWYRIHPENGRVEKLDGAPEGGSLLREGGKNDSWQPMPDGSVKLGWNEDKIREKSNQNSAGTPTESSPQTKTIQNNTTTK